IQLAPGANALKTADAVKARARELASIFPPGVKLAFPIDNTTFIRISIRDVIKTLIEATLLVVLVLAIGLLVDDAIVVVENVERVMREERLSPKEATKKSMTEITGALIGIALVLSAVFLPMAFFGGSVGVIYRQFSVTIVSAMVLSITVALILTPALCATLLKPIAQEDEVGKHGVLHRVFGGFFAWFNTTFEHGVRRYRELLE